MIIGHEKQRKFLRRSFEMQRIPHGLLLYGPEKLGKKTIALELVKLINCQNPKELSRPCLECRACADIEKNNYPDFTIIEPKEGGEIQIGQIRKLIWDLSLKPYSSRFKIALIDRAHLMNQEAQSCFLKLLEEPKGNTVLILISEYPELLLPTILSRVQKIRFFPVAKSEIENWLSNQLPGPQTKEAASLSFGKPGLACVLAADPEKIAVQKKFISDLINLSGSDLSARFQYVKALVNDEDANQTLVTTALDIWLKYFRGVLLAKVKTPSANVPLSAKYSVSKLEKIINLIQSTINLISGTNANPRLSLEILLMEI